jgi:hypothetical protein
MQSCRCGDKNYTTLRLIGLSHNYILHFHSFQRSHGVVPSTRRGRHQFGPAGDCLWPPHRSWSWIFRSHLGGCQDPEIISRGIFRKVRNVYGSQLNGRNRFDRSSCILVLTWFNETVFAAALCYRYGLALPLVCTR